MSTNTKRPAISKPDKTQLDAIRRLAHDDKLDDARTRLNVLRQRFPDFPPLLALAWEIEAEAGSPWNAVAHAFDWAQVSPNSEAALEALTEAAFASDLPMLGAATSMQLARLRGLPVEPLPPMETPFGPMSSEEAVQADISRMLLLSRRYDEVIDRLKDGRHPVVCNNRALARFFKGDVTQSLREFDDNWQKHPWNLFALKHMIRLRIWQRNRDYAAGLSAPLMATKPQRGEDALAKLHSLILLGLWDEAEASWQLESTADYWFAQASDLRGIFDYAGAIVALRTGDLRTAQKRLHFAQKAKPGYEPIVELARDLLTKPDTGGYIVQVGGTEEWFPNAWFSRLLESHANKKLDDGKQWQQQLAACDAHADYLGLAVEFGGLGASIVAMQILKQRATQGDREATDQLVSLLKRPCGTDKDRSNLLNWLTEEKLIDSSGGTPMLVNGEIRDLKSLTLHLTSEPTNANPYPPAVLERQEKMLELMRKRRFDEALIHAREICRLHPEAPMSHANVAMVMESQGKSNGEVEALFRQALELDQDYIFARAGLARILARRGDAAAAQTMLEPVYGREQYHSPNGARYCWRSARWRWQRGKPLRCKELTGQSEV